MQACHILLGRPWQFDKDSMHHSRLNQYSFLHHDKKIVLHPMSPEAIMHDDVAAAKKTKSHDRKERNPQAERGSFYLHILWPCWSLR
jgi:hypothetical protein